MDGKKDKKKDLESIMSWHYRDRGLSLVSSSLAKGRSRRVLQEEDPLQTTTDCAEPAKEGIFVLE